MALTISLDPVTESRLQEKAIRQGLEVEAYLRDLADWAAQLPDDDKDDNLTSEDVAAIRAGIRRGLEAEAAGKVRPASDFFAEMKSRYNIVEL